MEERKQFTFYSSWYKSLKKISKKSEQLEIFRAICELALFGEDTDLSGNAGAVFDNIRPIVLQGIAKSQAGHIGGIANRKQNESKDKANANLDIGIGIGIGIGKERKNKERKIASLSPTPTLEDVERYCAEKGYEHVSPKKFYSHYQSRGWKLYGSPIEDWRALADRWESEDAAKEDKPADPRRPIAPEQKATSGDIERLRRLIDEMNGEVQDA